MVVFKRLGLNDVGSPIQVGGNDWDEIYDFHNGVNLAGKSSEIQTPTTFQNAIINADSNQITNIKNADIKAAAAIAVSKLGPGTANQYLKTNPGGTAAEWAAGIITVSLDDVTDVVNLSPQRGHIIEYDGSNYVNKSAPWFGEKTGRWLGIGNTTADGLLNGSLVATSTIAIADVNNATYGHGKKFSDGTTTTPYGLKQQLASIYRREWSCRIRTLISPNTNGNQRIYTGYSSQSTDHANSDDILNALQGVFVIGKVGVTNLDVAHNDGVDVTVNDTTGIPYSSGSVYDIEIVLTNSDAKVYIGVNGAAPALTNTITLELPAAATDLYPFVMANRHGGAIKELDIYKVFVGTK